MDLNQGLVAQEGSKVNSRFENIEEHRWIAMLMETLEQEVDISVEVCKYIYEIREAIRKF